MHYGKSTWVWCQQAKPILLPWSKGETNEDDDVIVFRSGNEEGGRVSEFKITPAPRGHYYTCQSKMEVLWVVRKPSSIIVTVAFMMIQLL